MVAGRRNETQSKGERAQMSSTTLGPGVAWMELGERSIQVAIAY